MEETVAGGSTPETADVVGSVAFVARASSFCSGARFDCATIDGGLILTFTVATAPSNDSACSFFSIIIHDEADATGGTDDGLTDSTCTEEEEVVSDTLTTGVAAATEGVIGTRGVVATGTGCSTSGFEINAGSGEGVDVEFDPPLTERVDLFATMPSDADGK